MLNDLKLRTIELNETQELQDINQQFLMRMNLIQWYALRTSNQFITIRFVSDLTDKQYNELKLPYNEIHTEGFMDWFDFGNGIELLIKISFRAIEKKADLSSIYHLHITATSQRHTDHLIKRVKSNTKSTFWMNPPTLLNKTNQAFI